MAYKPVKRINPTVEFPLSTVSVTKGTALIQSSAGYLSSAAITSAAPVVAIAAVTQNGAATGRSGLASTTGSSDHVIIAWPVTPDQGFEALTSSTPTTAMLDGKWKVNGTTVLNETATDCQFIIEEITDATNKKVIGRFQSFRYIGGNTE